MARVKVVLKRKPKKNTKVESKQNTIIPRLRLEPRVSLNRISINNKSNDQDKKEQTKTEKTKNLKKTISDESIQNSNNENVKVSNSSYNKSAVLIKNKKISTEITTKSPSSTAYDTDIIEPPPPKFTLGSGNSKINISNMQNKKKSKLIATSRFWNDNERMELNTAIQMFGMNEYKKIAEFIQTKSEGDVRAFIKLMLSQYTREKREFTRRGPRWVFGNPKESDMKYWPNVRKWRKMAFNQMLPYTRTKNYSSPIMSSLCKRFYEEAEEISDPQVIDVKAIYKYMIDCIEGNIPSQLPPKESALVLELLKEVQLMHLQFDLEEEKQFIRNFQEATKFKPFQVKDEFKKKFKDGNIKNEDDDNAVPVPEDIFYLLSRHKQFAQSFNPLMTPLWMLQKEQEYLKNYLTFFQQNE